MGWGLERDLAPPQKNIMNFIGKVCCNSYKAVLAELQETCETTLAPKFLVSVPLEITASYISPVPRIQSRP